MLLYHETLDLAKLLSNTVLVCVWQLSTCSSIGGQVGTILHRKYLDILIGMPRAISPCLPKQCDCISEKNNTAFYMPQPIKIQTKPESLKKCTN